MKKKILFTVLIGMIVMLQSVSFGAELIIYGSGGVTVNIQTGEITICPIVNKDNKCATLIIEGDEIKILESTQGNYPGQGISGYITTDDGQVINVQIIQGNISVGSNGEYVLSNSNIQVINP